MKILNYIFELFSSLNVTFGGNILIMEDCNIPEYLSFLNVVEQSSIVLTLNNFCQFLSLDQFRLIKYRYVRILNFVLSNFNCYLLYAPESLVPFGPHDPPIHIHFTAFLNLLSNKHKTYNEFWHSIQICICCYISMLL